MRQSNKRNRIKVGERMLVYNVLLFVRMVKGYCRHQMRLKDQRRKWKSK